MRGTIPPLRVLTRKRGITLCGAGYGCDRFLFAQPATDRPGIDLKELCCPEAVASRVLEDSTDNGIVQFAHSSANSKSESKRWLDFHRQNLSHNGNCLGGGYHLFAGGRNVIIGIAIKHRCLC